MPSDVHKYSNGREITDEDLEGDGSACWQRSLERHRDYDLMFVERQSVSHKAWCANSSHAWIVNPAFEGTRYEPLKISGERLRCLRPEQLPLVIIATTSADRATKNIFPIARYINTIFERAPGEERRANVKTVGHNPRYTTHRLEVCKMDDPDYSACAATCEAPDVEVANTKVTQAEIMENARQPTVEREARHLAKVKDQPRGGTSAPKYFCGGAGQRLNLRLTNVLANRSQESASNGANPELRPELNPFWVVQTTKDVMRGHNDIFNPRIAAFVRQMYVESVNDDVQFINMADGSGSRTE